MLHTQTRCKLINDIYPGSSTHLKVVFREVLHQIELEFKSQFWGGRKPECPEETQICAWIFRWTKTLWKIRTGPRAPSLRAAAGLLLAKPSINMLKFTQQSATLRKYSALVLIIGGNTVTSCVGLVVHIISGAHSGVMSCDPAVHSWVKNCKPYSQQKQNFGNFISDLRKMKGSV